MYGEYVIEESEISITTQTIVVNVERAGNHILNIKPKDKWIK